jgi:hypothetical protein
MIAARWKYVKASEALVRFKAECEQRAVLRIDYRL